MKLLKNWKSKLSMLLSARTDESVRQETVAMVYGGDIYAVLLRDRVVRQLARSEVHRVDHRRDAGWPFIR